MIYCINELIDDDIDKVLYDIYNKNNTESAKYRNDLKYFSI